MTLSVTETIQAPGSDTAAHARRANPASEGVASTLASIGTAASEAVSATVSFSSQALHALEHAGQTAVEGVEDVAVGAWHAVEHAATEVANLAEAGWTGLKAGVAGLENAGEAVAGAVEDGVSEAVSGTRTVARQIGHYADVGLQATGEAVSEIASGTVMAAAAGGKALMAIL
jgi:phage-related protein